MEAREARGLRLIDELTIDFQVAFRWVTRSPAHSMAAIVVIAIAMTATTHLTAQLNAAFWRTLPVRSAESLRLFVWASPRTGFLNTPAFPGPVLNSRPTFASFSYPVYRAIQDEARPFSDVACWMDPGETLPVVMGDLGLGSVYFVSGNFFSTLGVRAAIGRLLSPDDDADAVPLPVVVLSDRFWRRAFGGDTAVLERRLTLNGTSFRIVGVTEPGFFGLDPANTPDVLAPMAMLHIASAGGPGVLQTQANWSVCRIVGRLRAGVTEEEGRAAAEAAMLRSMTTTPNWPPRGRVYDLPTLSLVGIERGLDDLRESVAPPLTVIATVVGVLLLIAVANVAGLLLARGVARETEVATRLALGASRRRLFRQLLTEALLLSLAGVAIAVVASYAVALWTPSLLSLLAPNFNAGTRPLGVSVMPDLRVLGWSLGITVLAAGLFGTIPAVRAARTDLLHTTRGPTMSSGKGSAAFAGQLLVGAQVGLAMVLVVGAALFVRTVVNLQSVDLGFATDRLLYARLEPRGGGVRVGSDGLSAGDLSRLRAALFEEAVTHLARTPGVLSASASVTPPLAEYDGAGASDELGEACTKYVASTNGHDATYVPQLVAPRFFETVRLPLLRGRDFAWSDRSLGRPRAVIVNEAFARRFFPPDVEVVGETVGMGRDCPGNPSVATIVGVVADSRLRPRADPTPMMYQLYGAPARPLTLILRTERDAAEVIPALRRTMKDLDARLPLFGEVTAEELLNQQIRQERLVRALLLVFALVALLLNCFGVYAVMAYRVGRRTAEIGVRLALGAQRQGIAAMLLVESLAPVVAGLVAGAAASFVLTRVMQSMLFGLNRPDAFTIGAAALALLSVAAIACLRPAVRACRIESSECAARALSCGDVTAFLLFPYLPLTTFT